MNYNKYIDHTLLKPDCLDKDTFLKMIEAGASRIGASKGVEIIKELKK